MSDVAYALCTTLALLALIGAALFAVWTCAVELAPRVPYLTRAHQLWHGLLSRQNANGTGVSAGRHRATDGTPAGAWTYPALEATPRATPTPTPPVPTTTATTPTRPARWLCWSCGATASVLPGVDAHDEYARHRDDEHEPAP